jgi:hypothetical protein
MVRPGLFTPGRETRYPLYKMLSRTHSLSGWVRKNMTPYRYSIPKPSSSEQKAIFIDLCRLTVVAIEHKITNLVT